MITRTTDGVKVSVVVHFKDNISSFLDHEYLFTYQITIENLGNQTIRLLKRHWVIFDSGAQLREIKGDGVVGRQPVLEPGQSHKYVSGCNLKSEVGKMIGSYLMERISDGSTFKVNIPEFNLVVPAKLN